MSLHARIVELERRGEAGVVCTVVRTKGSVPRHAGAKMLVHPDGRIEGTIGGGELESRVVREALAAAADATPRLVRYSLVDLATGDPGVCGGEMEVFVEPLERTPTILVIGAGHVGRALVHLGKWLGYRVVVSDDRAEQCSPEVVPGADDYLVMPVTELVRKFEFTPATCILMPTRGMLVDVEALPHLLDVPHAYIGVIGSRRRWATAVKALEERGIPRSKLARVHAPMGLELNAETPEEIALSVLAEIVMVRRKGSGESMKLLQEPDADQQA
jgi:xanthine dehydrogenase accessory factor